jgi:hypothetical protein
MWIDERFKRWRRPAFAAGYQDDVKKDQRAGRSERSHVAHHVAAGLSRFRPFQDEKEAMLHVENSVAFLLRQSPLAMICFQKLHTY